MLFFGEILDQVGAGGIAAEVDLPIFVFGGDVYFLQDLSGEIGDEELFYGLGGLYGYWAGGGVWIDDQLCDVGICGNGLGPSGFFRVRHRGV